MKIYTYLIPVLLVVCILASCAKEAVNTKGQDPYEETVLPAISIRKDGISPAQGKINDAVVIAGKGFSKNKEQMSVLFNGRKAEILEVTDTTVKVKVPILASSGGISIQVGQQYFFGPFFRVQGTFEMDVNYPSFRGANNVILDVIPDGDKFVIVGDFTDYDNKGYKFGINRVARINQNGTFDESFSHDVERGGSNSYVACVTHGPANSNKYFIGGGFNSFDNIPYANSIARLNRDGKIETDRITRAISGKDETISALKGGVSGQISAIYVQPDDKMIVMGGFQYYVKPNFNLISSDGRDSTHLDSTRVNNIIRLYPNGILDTSYNYDLANHRGREGANGSINKTIFLPDGKLLIAGNFTKFNGQDARRIARLNTDGSLDPSFNPGAGADLSVYNIERQPDGKILLMGAFNNYNGQRVMNVVRITADGAYDPSFKVAKGTDGAVFAAGFMPGGEIILSGFFEKFDDVVRNNIVVLNADGSLHPTYNTNGGITLGPNSTRGGVAKILQIPSEKAMLMVGSFTKFDYNSSNRIVKIKYQ
jgi:uncharacterized delta-60 repeat protein